MSYTVPARMFTFAAGIILALAGIALCDTLITTSGSKFEGTVTQDGDTYLLVTPNGGRMTFPKSLVSAVQKSAGQLAGSDGKSTSQPAGAKNTATIDPTGSEKKPTTEQGIMEVVATGVSNDPDKAIQAAFSQAIEQAVGVLVDAETLVKNDQIVREQILTFSRGFVKEYKMVRQWQKDGLSYAQIRASVETTKLTEKLKSNNIVTREVPGELLSRQFRFEVKNDDEAALMFKKIMDDFDMVKLTKVEIVGKPAIDREGTGAKMTVTVKVSPDGTAWNAFARNLSPFLAKVATRRARITLSDSFLKEDGPSVLKQLEGKGALIGVAANVEIAGKQVQWDVYRVPQPLETSHQAIPAASSDYQVVLTLLDRDGKEILRTSEPLKDSWLLELGALQSGRAIWSGRGPTSLEFWSISPFWHVKTFGRCHQDITTKVSTALSNEDLGKVAKVAVSLEAKEKH